SMCKERKMQWLVSSTQQNPVSRGLGAEEIGNTAEAARRYELHPNLVYRWLGAYGRDGEAAFVRKNPSTSQGVPVDTARIREIESENERLKRILGEKKLEIAILRDLLERRGADPHRYRG